MSMGSISNYPKILPCNDTDEYITHPNTSKRGRFDLYCDQHFESNCGQPLPYDSNISAVFFVKRYVTEYLNITVKIILCLHTKALPKQGNWEINNKAEFTYVDAVQLKCSERVIKSGDQFNCSAEIDEQHRPRWQSINSDLNLENLGNLKLCKKCKLTKYHPDAAQFQFYTSDRNQRSLPVNFTLSLCSEITQIHRIDFDVRDDEMAQSGCSCWRLLMSLFRKNISTSQFQPPKPRSCEPDEDFAAEFNKSVEASIRTENTSQAIDVDRTQEKQSSTEFAKSCDSFKSIPSRGPTPNQSPPMNRSYGTDRPILSSNRNKNFSGRDLTSKDIRKISKRLTNQSNLRDVSYNLGLESYTVNEALNRNQNLSVAAEEIFEQWLLGQDNRQEAYWKMYTALKEAEMNLIVGDILENGE